MKTAIIFILIAVIVIQALHIKAMRKTVFYLRDRLDFQNVFQKAESEENRNVASSMEPDELEPGE